MPVRIIPREQWPAFLTSFSRQHEGWLVTIEGADGSAPAQMTAHNVPLSEITVEPTREDAVIVSILSDRQQAAYRISQPESIRLEENSQHAHESLTIKSRNGAATVIRFRSAIPAEAVAGMLQ